MNVSLSIVSPHHTQPSTVSMFEQRNYYLFRCTGIGGALEHDQLPGAQPRCERLDGIGDIAQIRLVVFVQWRGHTDQHHIHLAQTVVVAGSFKTARLRTSNLVWRDADDVGTATVQRLHLGFVNIEACYAKALFTEEQRQGKPHVPESDDADARCTVLDTLFQLLRLTSRHSHLSLLNIGVRLNGRSIQSRAHLDRFLPDSLPP